MKYKYMENAILRIDDGAVIPINVENKDYEDFLDWVAKGNTPLPKDPPPPPTQDELDAQASRNYAKLAALRAMTPAQVSSWVDANINNLADAKDALKTLAIAVGILARRI